MTNESLRTRPSFFLSVAPTAASLIHNLNSVILSNELNNKIAAGMERGIQIENDEQLRILNERNIDKSDPTNAMVRKSLIKMRDESYDFTERENIIVNEDAEDGEGDKMDSV